MNQINDGGPAISVDKDSEYYNNSLCVCDRDLYPDHDCPIHGDCEKSTASVDNQSKAKA